jgi:signal transduction histidine kinase
VAVSLADISLRKQAEQQRVELGLERERIRVLRSFVADASHDLNTPLTIITTNMYLMKQYELSPPLVKMVDQTMLQARRLSSMIKDLLRLSELDAMSNDGLTLRPMEINSFVERLVADFVPVAESRQQGITFLPAAKPTQVHIDQARLEVALNNLIENATKYTPQSSAIEVAVTLSNGHVAITVADDGDGIPEADLPHIFERFYRGQKHRPANSGTGLGLAIAKRTVEMHRGSISACNRPTGGAQFTVRLPATTEG